MNKEIRKFSDKTKFSSGFQFAFPEENYISPNVDMVKGVIKNVSIVTAGEAKGHGVSLDKSFIKSVIEQGEAKGKVKSGFGHDNPFIERLGSYLGVFKNFRGDEDENPSRVLADLYLSTTAKKSPIGNLYDYILEMADQEPKQMGNSIVFSIPEENGFYRKAENGRKVYDTSPEFWEVSEPTFVVLDELDSSDIVDEPAANPNGLFSSRFESETFSKRFVEFFDIHPEALNAIDDESFSKFSMNFNNKNDNFNNKNKVKKMEDNGAEITLEVETADAVEEVEEVIENAEEITNEVEETEVEEVTTEVEAIEEVIEEAEEITDEEEEEKELVELSAEQVKENAKKEVLSFMAEITEKYDADTAYKVLSTGGDAKDAKIYYLEKQLEQKLETGTVPVVSSKDSSIGPQKETDIRNVKFKIK